MRHVSAREFARYREGVAGGRRASRIGRHVSGCARCGALGSSMDGLSALLAAVPAAAMPDQVADRIQAAIVTEAARRAAAAASAVPGRPASPATASPTATPAAPRPARRGRGVPWPLALSGLAAASLVLVLVGAGFLIAQRAAVGPSSGPAPASQHGAVRNPAAAGAQGSGSGSAVSAWVPYRRNGHVMTVPLLTFTGNVTAADLTGQVRHSLAAVSALSAAKYANARPTAAGQVIGKPTSAVSRLRGCLTAVSRSVGGEEVLVATATRYEGSPATIIVLRRGRHASVLDVVVVGLSCSASATDRIISTTVPAR